MKHSYILYLFIGILFSLSYSCKTSKSLIEIKDQVQKKDIKPNEVPLQELPFEWFDGKFNADINNNGKLNSVKGRARIRKDSLIWISIKPDVAIIEAFRILISPDSIQLIDYINKKYFIDRISGLKDFINYDISFQMVQNIFVGNPTFIMDMGQYQVSVNRENANIISSSDLKTYMDARNAGQKANYLFQAIWVNNKSHTRNVIYDPANRIELDLQYKEFQMIDSLMYPKTAALTIVGDSVNTQFSFTYTKTDLINTFDFPFTIPASYERMYLKPR